MIGIKILILAALAFLLPTVQSAVYSVAVKYDMTDDGDCSNHSAKLDRVSDISLFKAGVLGEANTDHWDTYVRIHDKLTKVQNKIDKVQEKYNHATKQDPERRLGGCSSGRCYAMCMTTGLGIWCSCCSCCHGRDRRRRNLRSLEIEDSGEVDALEELAEEQVIWELQRYHDPVPCLAYPYTVTVDIVSLEETVEEYETKKKAREAKRAARLAKRANKEARMEVRTQLKISRQILKAGRRQLAIAREAVREAETAELAAEQAVQLEEAQKREEAQLQNITQGETGEATP